MVKSKIEVGTLVETRWGTLATVEAVNGDMLTVRLHPHYSEMTKVVYENGHSYDLENSQEHREALTEQQEEIARLRKVLADALARIDEFSDAK